MDSELIALCPVCVPEKPAGVRITDIHCPLHGLELLEKNNLIEPHEQAELDDIRNSVIRARLGDAVIFGLVLFFGTYVGWHVWRFVHSPPRWVPPGAAHFRQPKGEPIGALPVIAVREASPARPGDHITLPEGRQDRKRSRAGTL